MEAEINPIHNEDFESRLRDYYYVHLSLFRIYMEMKDSN
jgi:hypothetical protein